MDRSDPIRVVYADGDAGTRSTVARRLSDDAIEVVTAETLAATLDRVGAGGIDCVVAGDLPDGTGLDLREAVGKRRSELPVVLYPAEGSEALPSRSGNNERHYLTQQELLRASHHRPRGKSRLHPHSRRHPHATPWAARCGLFRLIKCLN